MPRRLREFDCRPRSDCLPGSRRTLPRWPQPGSLAAATIFCILGAGCSSFRPPDPSIEFTHVPASGQGNPDQLERIEGRVSGAQTGHHIVLFALAGVWWVQPLANQPFTAIQPDSTWKSWTHPGSAYAALLVDVRYRPPATVTILPEKGGPVLAVARVDGVKARLSSKMLDFSGYQWEARQTASDRSGSRNFHDPSNAWVDPGGSLHLRIARHQDHWTSAEVKLTRSLGYGSYRFVVHDISLLEPAAVLSFFTWDDFAPPREMDIEIGRWGEPDDKNAQYVIQPHFVPANTVRFSAPEGTLSHWMIWEPGRVSFRTFRGSSSGMNGVPLAAHDFTSGVPSPGNEMVRMNLYVYDNHRTPLHHDSEVVIEKFEFRP